MGICRWIAATALTFYVVTQLRVWAMKIADEGTVSFLVLAPYGGNGGEMDPGWKAGPALIPAVRLAVNRINNRTDLLPGYRIKLLEGNSGCQHESTSTHSFVSDVFYVGRSANSSAVVGVIGPACSESALRLGALGARDAISIIQVSAGATSPQLTETDKYPYTFRTMSTSLQHIGALARLMAFNSWRRVAVMHDNTRTYFRLLSEKLIANLGALIGYHSEIYESFYPLSGVEARHKVIVLLAGSKLSRQVICLAYHYRPQIIYPVYQWIIIEKAKSQFLTNTQFMYNGKFYNCSVEMMNTAIDRAIFTTYRLLSREHHEENKETDVDLTFAAYKESYNSYRERHEAELANAGRNAEYETDAIDYAVSYYDATWALALALNQSFFTASNNSLADYAHGQPKTTRLIKQSLSHLKFEGLMGKIEFRESTQDSSTPINIHQSIADENVLIAIYNGTGLEKISERGEFVVDTFHRRVIGVHPAATGIVALLVLTLAVYLFLLHAGFFVFHMHKSIKAESFSLSHFMFSGCYLILLRVSLSAVLHADGWDTNSVDRYHSRMVGFGVTCNVSEWLNSIGVCLVMGTLGGKLWRIYRLFNHFTTPSYLVSDQTLTCIVVVVVTVNVVILTLWTSIDPFLAVFEQEDIGYDGGEPVILDRAYCRCSYLSVWISLTYGVIISLVTCILLLSVMNRRVNRKYFQTAKSVNVMVYLLALSCFLGIALAFVFESLDPHYTYISWQFSLLSIVLLICVFVFTPPILTILKDRCVCFKKCI